MKIIENTPDRLVVRKAPWIMGYVFIAGMVLICRAFWKLVQAEEWRDGSAISLLITFCLLALATAVFIRRDELILDRRSGIMQFRHTNVFGRKKDELDLDLLERASTQTSYLSGSKQQITYRLALILKDHPNRDPRSHPTKDIRLLTPVYTGGKDAENAAKTINLWIRE
jgi:hypothetical protein